MDDVGKLRAIPLFTELRTDALERLAGVARHESHPKGARVFAEGEPGQSMYFIEAGRVRISKELPGMGEEALAILGPGSVFGEMAVLDGSRRSATAIVHEDVELLVIDGEAFDRLLSVDKELAYVVLRAMTRTLAGRLRETTDKLMTVFLMSQFG